MSRVVSVVFALGALACSVDGVASPGAGGKADVLGDDDRQQIDESDHPRALAWARSTAVVMPRRELVRDGAVFRADPPTLAGKRHLCVDERFANEPAPGFCSSFLIAPDIAVTAGHCVAHSACPDMAFVFDFWRGGASADPRAIPAASVFFCDRVLARENQIDGEDYAVIQLDRPAIGRTPLRVSATMPELGDRVALIGYPAGIWAKIDTAGVVVDSRGPKFFATLDSFGGHSGGVVIDLFSHSVVGVHVTGARSQFVFDDGCGRHARCDGPSCIPSGEVTAALFAGAASAVAPVAGSCVDACGLEASRGAECSCDLGCQQDCCEDFELACAGTVDAPACIDGGGLCTFDEDCLVGSCACRDGSLATFGSDGSCANGVCRSTAERCAELCGDSGIAAIDPNCSEP